MPSVYTQGMNLRHAVTLALVGWYLMVPPTDGNGHFFKDRPLSEWHITVSSSFDSARDCLAERQAYVASYQVDHAMLDFVLASQCLSTDDPRLRETK